MLIFPREVESMKYHYHPCYLHRVEEHLPSIWLYCDVGPSPVYTSLSVSIVSMPATFMTFIIHTYLHHLCIPAFFNNHLFRIYLSSKRKKKKKEEKKQVWACHLSSRLSPISRKTSCFSSSPLRSFLVEEGCFSFSSQNKGEDPQLSSFLIGYKVLIDCLFPIHSWLEPCLCQRFKFRFLKQSREKQTISNSLII